MSEKNTDVRQEQENSQLLQIRRDKLSDLRQRGKDPFSLTKYDVSHHSTEIKELFDELEGKTLVAFETCSIVAGEDNAAVEIVNHRDINNKAQTVYFDVPQTGQTGPWRLLIPVGFFTAAAIGLLIRRLRRI